MKDIGSSPGDHLCIEDLRRIWTELVKSEVMGMKGTRMILDDSHGFRVTRRVHLLRDVPHFDATLIDHPLQASFASTIHHLMSRHSSLVLKIAPNSPI